MPLSVYTRIAIAGRGGVENAPTHGLVDLAAAMAADTWSATPLGAGADALYSAIDHLSVQHTKPLADAFGALVCLENDAVRYGARLGYSLARTEYLVNRGWETWLDAAEKWLERSGCIVADHQASSVEQLARETRALSI